LIHLFSLSSVQVHLFFRSFQDLATNHLKAIYLHKSAPQASKNMSAAPPAPPNLDRYVVIHVATTCDEHGVYVTKDSAEVIELGWILLDAKTCDEVGL
jgi:hypothetical protein